MLGSCFGPLIPAGSGATGPTTGLPTRLASFSIASGYRVPRLATASPKTPSQLTGVAEGAASYPFLVITET